MTTDTTKPGAGASLRIPAEWTDDCQGKKDFDGALVSVSTRYWPAGGGFLVGDARGFNASKDLPEFQHIKPHANCRIVLRYSNGDWNEWADLTGKDFKGESFDEVKAQVEEWAQAQYERVVRAVRTEFAEAPK